MSASQIDPRSDHVAVKFPYASRGLVYSSSITFLSLRFLSSQLSVIMLILLRSDPPSCLALSKVLQIILGHLRRKLGRNLAGTCSDIDNWTLPER